MTTLRRLSSWPMSWSLSHYSRKVAGPTFSNWILSNIGTGWERPLS